MRMQCCVNDKVMLLILSYKNSLDMANSCVLNLGIGVTRSMYQLCAGDETSMRLCPSTKIFGVYYNRADI